MPLLTNNSDIQLRVYMDSASNQINQSTLTGTGVSTINSCNVICKITRLDQITAQNTLATLSKSPFHHLFHDLRFGQFNILNSTASTALSAQIVLTPIVGKIAMLYFFLRPVDKVTGLNQLKFTPITSYSILDSTSTNIVGGQDILNSVHLNYLSLFNCQSSYVQEIASGITDNSANVYCYSFSSDPIECIKTGQLLGSRQFTGNESLKINFTSGSGITSNYTLTVYAYCESAIEQGTGYIKKLSL